MEMLLIGALFHYSNNQKNDSGDQQLPDHIIQCEQKTQTSFTDIHMNKVTEMSST